MATTVEFLPGDLYANPQLFTLDGLPIGLILIEYVQWTNGNWKPFTGESYWKVVAQRAIGTSREATKHYVESRLSYIQGFGCDGVYLWSSSSQNRVKVTLIEQEQPRGGYYG